MIRHVVIMGNNFGEKKGGGGASPHIPPQNAPMLVVGNGQS